jgi:hypothetical protein
MQEKKLFYRCDDRLCKNAFINWCKYINDIKLTTEEEEGVNEIDQIKNKMKRTNDELHWVWIKNHNIKANFASVKLLLFVNTFIDKHTCIRPSIKNQNMLL